MTDIVFDFDWVDGAGVRGDELSATWATLEIRIKDSVVTRVHDARARTVRNFVYVPLYPLAEWLVGNWWFLNQELLNPVKERDPDFRRRHALDANSEGYAFPSLEVIPFGTRTQLVWGNAENPWTRVEFLNKGKESIDGTEFKEACADFVDQVIRRLVFLGVDETFLQQDWEAIRRADEDESKFCEVAGGLGWDPYDLDNARRMRLIELSGRLGDLLEEAIPALDSSDLETGSTAIASAISDAKANGLSLKSLDSFRIEATLNQKSGPNPWDVGYELARRLRQNLLLDMEPLTCLSRIAEVLGEDPESLEAATRPIESLKGAALVDGVVTKNDQEQPCFAFRQYSDHARRFLFCRGLAEVITYPGSDSLITKARSERQQSNRAFAAEFLAPSEGLKKKISKPYVDNYDIDDMAEYFGVSPLVVRHQVVNHKIAFVDAEGIV